MRQLAIVLLIIIGGLSASARTIYVSSSRGDDSNAGMTAAYPKRSIKIAIEKADTILLKAGDIFYESGLSIINKCFSRYGEGNNPMVTGFRIPGITSRWISVGNSIWRMDLYDKSYTGVQNDLNDVYCNNVGCLYEFDKDLVHGRKVQFYDELKKDWDFWQTEKISKDTKPEDFRYVYLFLDKDPNTLNLQFSTGTHAATVKNSVIDGVNFIGFGFGISAWSNTQIRNCKIDIIGGRTFIGYGEFCNYGNGIEFYVAHDIENCIIEDCWISRCYDCGATIQGKNSGKAKPKNIVFKNNLLTNNCQGWEDFLRNDPNVFFENCFFEDNIVLNSGVSGFGYSDGRIKFCHVLGNNIYGPRYMNIKNNIFIGGNFYCSGGYKGLYKSNVWSGNKCYIEYGDFLFHDYWDSKNAIRLSSKDGSKGKTDKIAEYRKRTGDMTTKFYIKSRHSIDKLVAKQKKKYFKNHNY